MTGRTVVPVVVDNALAEFPVSVFHSTKPGSWLLLTKSGAGCRQLPSLFPTLPLTFGKSQSRVREKTKGGAVKLLLT